MQSGRGDDGEQLTACQCECEPLASPKGKAASGQKKAEGTQGPSNPRANVLRCVQKRIPGGPSLEERYEKSE